MDYMIKNALVPLILRWGLAVIFIFHGHDKVFAEGNHGGTAWIKGDNAPSTVVQMAVAYGELAGGVAMAIGLLSRLAALGLAAIMAGAIYTVHGQHGFSLQNHGYEYNFAILVICAAVFLLGSGLVSVDRVLFRRKKPT
jgi:putative oxidoreductase